MSSWDHLVLLSGLILRSSPGLQCMGSSCSPPGDASCVGITGACFLPSLGASIADKLHREGSQGSFMTRYDCDTVACRRQAEPWRSHGSLRKTLGIPHSTSTSCRGLLIRTASQSGGL